MKQLFAFALVVLAFGLPQQASSLDRQRFPILSPDKLTPEQKKWADEIAAPPRNAKFTNPPYNEYIRSPELAARATALAGYLRWNTSLSPRLSEFAILIAARQWTQQYEWHQHYPLAIKAGLDPKILADMIVGKRPSEMKEDETILYEFATQLYRDKNVSDGTFDAAVAKLGERSVMDLIGILGYYDFVSMTLIAAKAEPPQDAVPRMQPIPK
jgi:4-carboxymuconolactone decarboxylase